MMFEVFDEFLPDGACGSENADSSLFFHEDFVVCCCDDWLAALVMGCFGGGLLW